jgi:hypothetical protein
LTEVLELPELAIDLLVDVERFLALAQAPLVAGDDQLADLLPERSVGAQAGSAGVGGEQLLHLGIYVECLTPLRHAAIGSGLDHLANLLLTDLGRDRMDRALVALREILLQREIALADLLQGTSGAHRKHDRAQRERDEDHDDEDGAQLK